MAIITTGITITSPYESKYIGELPIRADSASVDQWCTEKGYEPGGTFTQDGGTWSNTGARFMNYYGSIEVIGEDSEPVTEYHWFNLYGYGSIVTSITEPEPA